MDDEKQQGTSAPDAEGGAPAMEQILSNPLVAGAVSSVRDAIVEAKDAIGELTLTVRRERIREVCESFKNDGFTYLVDLTGVDYSTYPAHEGDRFAVAYMLYSFDKNERVRLKVFTSDQAIPSVTSVWKTANWHEREVWDMFGVAFSDHPNLERILMWEEFNGHPLRKDFPVRGIDTGARIYPEIFPDGGGPKAGSTGKSPDDVNLFKGEWKRFGIAPVSQPAEEPKRLEAGDASAEKAETKDEAAKAPWHDESLTLPERMKLATGKGLKDKLFAAMAQTDCEACGWDCEGYADAIAKGETSDLTLCVPGEEETETKLVELMKEAGKL